MDAPKNTDDVIDSRDIIQRIEEIQDLLPDCAGEIMPGTSDEIQELKIELAALKALAKEGEASPDWPYGETLIRDSYFEDYAQEFAEDCCEMPKSDVWPLYCIDWERAANDLKMDYMSVDFDGINYWIRA